MGAPLSDPMDVVRGAIDLYVHAAPDLLPRRGDDLALAAELRDAGLAAAVHRHHFSSTAERSRLASDATGFRLLGAILLNESVGGFNATAVEIALRMGAVWVGLPTLSARHYRSRIARLSEERRRRVAFGRGDMVATDERGAVLAALEEILALVADARAVLNLGYLDHRECVAVAEAAARQRVRAVVLTNPRTIGGFSDEQVAAVTSIPNTYVELTAYVTYAGRSDGAEVPIAAVAEQLRRFGVERCVLSSDSGGADGPAAADLLAATCAALAQNGLAPAELRALTHDQPARILGLN